MAGGENFWSGCRTIIRQLIRYSSDHSATNRINICWTRIWGQLAYAIPYKFSQQIYTYHKNDPKTSNPQKSREKSHPWVVVVELHDAIMLRPGYNNHIVTSSGYIGKIVTMIPTLNLTKVIKKIIIRQLTWSSGNQKYHGGIYAQVQTSC